MAAQECMVWGDSSQADAYLAAAAALLAATPLLIAVSYTNLRKCMLRDGTTIRSSNRHLRNWSWMKPFRYMMMCLRTLVCSGAALCAER